MSSSNSSYEVIQQLQYQIEVDQDFANALTNSLVSANTLATANLDLDLYNALNELYSNDGWPLNPQDYLSYLTIFAEVIPSENSGAYDPWQNTPGVNGYSREIYDRLCQFYWLIDQGAAGFTLQDYVSTVNGFVFADWLVAYAIAWGSFLDTPASLTPAALLSYQNDPEYNLQDYSDDSPNWVSFNTFFYRQLNSIKPDGTPMRPIANPGDNTVICSPADCTFKASYQIDGNGNVLDTDGNPTMVTLKETHTIGNINDLLAEGGNEYALNFYNGTFVHYFLSPFDYHRFHTPVSGTVLDLAAVQGKVYLAVDIADNQFDAPDSSEDGYEFSQARGVLVIDTSTSGSNIGLVATVPIGMCQVSSVTMYTAELQGAEVVKGQEFGHFAFGGSDIIMLFEQPLNELKLITNVANAQPPASYQPTNPYHFKYGEVSVIITA
ncbi:phosphatidylserine decarboxylase [Mucilaginibacter dorajii]|uniref:Phosphatidylserine decarboxylase n=1 Tax=Mucilaginibacter dorajii TaxID=692994 RepID=A0ABP7PBD3_9SPHI|nr:phosphatidylserine decarboxylase [Mucilaginibacter dorajii]MCS3734835.1 phosphatidylserine decarboxylase precursor [Mucilaginibacter dorajii]